MTQRGSTPKAAAGSNTRANFRKPLLTPIWWSLPGIAFQALGVFLLPLLVALPIAIAFEASELFETGPVFLTVGAVLLFPTFLLQLVGLVLKSRKELTFWRSEQELTLTRLLDVIYRHISVVTFRGWTLLIGGLALTVLAIVLKWASLGTLAVAVLLLFYVMVGWTLFTSTFAVRTFQAGLDRNQRGIQRQMQPAVAAAGQPVTEVVRFRNIPVPPGYVLLLEDPNDPRLNTESRYVIGAGARSGEIEVSGNLRSTPRGIYRLGPARLMYQDILGVTRVSVASVATADLKVLPKLQPVVIQEPPQSRTMAPDIITKPHRFATEDYFRFRQYQAGDDTRRLHWRLSMRVGSLQVRLPESKEIDSEKIVLIIDTFLPQGRLLKAADGAGDILDALVLAFLGIGRELVARGHQVVAVAPVISPDGKRLTLERLDGRRAQSRRWQDMGARVVWQGDYDVARLMDEVGEDTHGVVVTARFTAPPPTLLEGQTTTWLFMDPADALGPRDPHWLVKGGSLRERLLSLLRLPNPVGSTENTSFRRIARLWQDYERYHARRVLRAAAKKRAGRTRDELVRRGDAVYAIERTPTAIRLIGLVGRSK